MKSNTDDVREAIPTAILIAQPLLPARFTPHPRNPHSSLLHLSLPQVLHPFTTPGTKNKKPPHPISKFSIFRRFLNYPFAFGFPKVSVAKLVDAGSREEERDDDEEFGDVYHSPRVFKLNYAEMEKRFKVYIYPDGDPKTFYQTPRKLTGKYASEGYFFQNIRESRFRTLDPDQAHLFFIPISCHKMRGKVCY